MLKKGNIDADADDDDEVRTNTIIGLYDSNIECRGILPQGSVFIALPSNQQKGGGDRN
jgi:hypothetical protein